MTLLLRINALQRSFLLQMTGELFCQLRSFPPVTYVSIRSVRLSLASANLLVLLVETILLFDNRVGGGDEPPTSHTTVRTVPYTAVSLKSNVLFDTSRLDS